MAGEAVGQTLDMAYTPNTNQVTDMQCLLTDQCLLDEAQRRLAAQRRDDEDWLATAELPSALRQTRPTTIGRATIE